MHEGPDTSLSKPSKIKICSTSQFMTICHNKIHQPSNDISYFVTLPS